MLSHSLRNLHDGVRKWKAAVIGDVELGSASPTTIQNLLVGSPINKKLLRAFFVNINISKE